jgi:hypothetical protein
MSKRITDVPEATRIDSQDQILFLQASTKKTKRISRDNFASSPGFSETVITSEGGDTTPPAVPTGLAVTTTSEIMADGTERVIIRAKINPNTEQDLATYAWYIRRASGTPTFDGGGVLTGYSVAQVFSEVVDLMPAEGSVGADGKVTKEWIVVANSYYEVRVRAIDVNDNSSVYTQLNNTNVILSSKDSTAPAAPTSVSATSAIRSVFVVWTNPADRDLAYVRLFRPTVAANVRAISSATRSGTTVTITTSAAHGFSNGNSVTVVGLSGTVNPTGERTVTVVNSTQFTYTLASGTGSETYTRTNAITTLTSNVFSVFDGYADAFTDTSTVQGETYYYWLTAVDYSGNVSAFPSNVATTTPGTVETTDVKDFAINATKMYNDTIVLEGDSWTSNTVTFTISWNSHFLYYRGVKYTVASGSVTASSEVAGQRVAYVYATIPVSGTSITYTTFVVTGTLPPNDYPVLTDSMFMIATNVNGAYDLAWNAIANAVIGSAFIKNAAIDSAKIREVIADRISTGTIDAKTLTITGGGVIKSAGVTNFTTGQGFYLEGTTLGTTSRFGVGDLSGSGSFVKFDVNTLTVQGQIRATSGFIGGTAAGWSITSNKISSGTVTLDATAGAQKIFIGTGTYNNTNTSFYTDSSGNFSLGSSLTFASNVLTVNGAVNATSGYFGSASSAVSINSTGLTIGTTGRINGNIDYNASFNPPFGGGTNQRGFYLGFANSAYQFFIGHGGASPGAYFYWNGTALTVVGSAINQGTISGDSTLGGRTGSIIAGVINSNSQIVTTRLNTESKQILSDFNFGTTDYAGAVKTGTIAWDTSGVYTSGTGVAVYRGGIVGANGTEVTFSISSSTGNATFKGTVSATAGDIGGWTINPVYLAKDTGSASSSSGMAPLDYPFYAGSTYANRATAPFRVTPAGAMTATSGAIGNWSITSGSIVNTTASRTTTLSSDATITLSNPSGSGTITIDSSSSVSNISGGGTYNYSLISGNVNSRILFSAGSTSCLLAYNGLTIGSGAFISSTYFETGVSGTSPISVDVKSANLRVKSGTTLMSELDYTTGGFTSYKGGNERVYINNSSVNIRAGNSISLDSNLVKNISSASRSSTTVTVNTSTNHQFATGDTVTIAGLIGSVDPNGARVITVTSVTQFTYTLGSGAGTETYTLSSATATLAGASISSQYFQAGVTTAVDVKDVNLRIFQGATQRARIDYTTGDYYIQFNKIIGTRKTGWTAPTGTATRTSFDTSTVTTQQLAERVKAMLDDLISHGLLGA